MSDMDSERSIKKSFNILSVLGLVVGLAVGVTLSQWSPDEGKPLVHSAPKGSDQDEWQYQQAATDPDEVEEVRKVQKMLSEKGYDPGSVDGQMGADTAKAIRQFQRDRGKRQTGQVSTGLVNDLEATEELLARPAPPPREKGIGINRKQARRYFDQSSSGFNFNWQKPVQGHARVRAVSIEKQAVLELTGPEDDLVNAELTMPMPGKDDQKAMLKNTENTVAYLGLVAPEAVGWGRENMKHAKDKGRTSKNFGDKRVDIFTDQSAQTVRIRVESVPSAATWPEQSAKEEGTPSRPSASSPNASKAGTVTLSVSGPAPAGPGATILIDTMVGDVQLCPSPECLPEEDIRWLTSDQSFRVLDVAAVETPGAIAWDLVWYQVKASGGSVGGVVGWISEYDTDKAPERPRFK
jgi:peptidoglycan hydrolase-like protein with peptidoglycan-binding domain